VPFAKPILGVVGVLLTTLFVFGPWLYPWAQWILNRSVEHTVENVGLGLIAVPIFLLAFWKIPNKMNVLIIMSPLLSPYAQHYSFASITILMGGPVLTIVSWVLMFLRMYTDHVGWLILLPFIALLLNVPLPKFDFRGILKSEYRYGEIV